MMSLQFGSVELQPVNAATSPGPRWKTGSSVQLPRLAGGVTNLNVDASTRVSVPARVSRPTMGECQITRHCALCVTPAVVELVSMVSTGGTGGLGAFSVGAMGITLVPVARFTMGV